MGSVSEVGEKQKKVTADLSDDGDDDGVGARIQRQERIDVSQRWHLFVDGEISYLH
jgi:hypothetical protein